MGAEHEAKGQWIVMAVCHADEYAQRDGEWRYLRRVERYWYAVDVRERPNAPFNRWDWIKKAPRLPANFPSWESFWRKFAPGGRRSPRKNGWASRTLGTASRHNLDIRSRGTSTYRTQDGTRSGVIMGRVSGKVAIVTGANRGLGQAFAHLLTSEGAKVVATDININGAAMVEKGEQNTLFLRQDVSSEERWLSVIQETEARFGPVSILVNNAGVTSPKIGGAIEKTSLDDFNRIISVNQTGVFLGMKTVFPSMRRAGGGSIINISSVSGLVGKEHTIAYTASKFAVRGMSKVAAIEYGPHNIRVNSIHPGPIDTQMLYAPDGSMRPVIQKIMETLPAGRFGHAEEIAQLVLLLASDEMKFATGAEFVIDGGMTCG